MADEEGNSGYVGTKTVHMKVVRLKDSTATQRFPLRGILPQQPPEEEAPPPAPVVFDFEAASAGVLKGLFDTYYDGVLLTDEDGAIRYVNRRLRRFTSVRKETFLEMNITDVISGADSELVEAVRDTLEGGELVMLDSEIRCAGAETFPAEVVATRVTLEGETKLIFFIRNIYRRRELELALRDSERRCGDILESLSDWIWEIDVEGEYVYCSDSVSQFLGYTGDDVIGHSLFDLVAEGGRDAAQQEFNRLVESREPMEAFELSLESQSGDVDRFVYTGIPVMASDGTVLGYQGIALTVNE
jgi:PAS domain S-box-containing protein